MPDPTGPRAVADDPSGIVQQMPDGGDQALKPCPFCGKPPKIDNYGNGYYRIDHWCYDTVMDNFIAVEGERKSDVETRWNRRATEADLRAEVERLRAALDPNQTKTAYMGEIKMTVHDVCEDEDGNLVDHPREVTVDWTTIKAVMAMIRARAALSPETDGGQDG